MAWRLQEYDASAGMRLASAAQPTQMPSNPDAKQAMAGIVSQHSYIRVWQSTDTTIQLFRKSCRRTVAAPYPLQDFRLAMLSAKAVLLVIGRLHERDFPCAYHRIATFCGVAVGRRASRQLHDCDKGLS